jgi:hypothetical protein
MIFELRFMTDVGDTGRQFSVVFKIDHLATIQSSCVNC